MLVLYELNEYGYTSEGDHFDPVAFAFFVTWGFSLRREFAFRGDCGYS